MVDKLTVRHLLPDVHIEFEKENKSTSSLREHGRDSKLFSFQQRRRTFAYCPTTSRSSSVATRRLPTPSRWRLPGIPKCKLLGLVDPKISISRSHELEEIVRKVHQLAESVPRRTPSPAVTTRRSQTTPPSRRLSHPATTTLSHANGTETRSSAGSFDTASTSRVHVSEARDFMVVVWAVSS